MITSQLNAYPDLVTLNHFFKIVETDNSSILYHTRCFDSFIFDCILTDFAHSVTNNVEGDSYFFGLFFKIKIFSEFINLDSIAELFSLSKFLLQNNLTFSDSNAFIFFSLLVFSTYFDISGILSETGLILLQNSNVAVVTKTLVIFADLVFYFDFFFYMFEVLALFSVFFYFKSSFGFLLSLISAVYVNILNFFIKNGLSLVEFSFLFTFFIFFIIFDMFVSFSEDDFFDIFFYIIIIFITLTFFFINMALDIQYFFMMNSVNNGYLNFRVLFFDIVNNFLCLLRVFSCWVRYIFYDLQVELLDLSFWYIDYSNDYLLFDNSNNFFKSNNSIMLFFKIFFLDLINFFFDIVFILVQIWVSFVKVFLASYLLWLITDLFILRVFGLSESRSIHKF